MPHWEDVQHRAKKLIEEGLMLLRTGAHEAEYIANTTASAARLHMTLKKNRYELYRALHDLGDQVQRNARPGATTVTLTPAMQSLLTRIAEMEKAAARAEQELSGFTVVDKQKKKPPRSTSKGTTKTTKKSTKNVSKKK